MENKIINFFEKNYIIAGAIAFFAVLSLFIQSAVPDFSLSDYLPESAPPVAAARTNAEEFNTEAPNARVMVENVTIPEAAAYKEKISGVIGVNSVNWLDDATSLEVPLEFMDEELTEVFYKDKRALFDLNIDMAKADAAIPAIRKIIGAGGAMEGAPVREAALKSSGAGFGLKWLWPLLLFAAAAFFLSGTFAAPAWVLLTAGAAYLLTRAASGFFGELPAAALPLSGVIAVCMTGFYSLIFIKSFRPAEDYKKSAADALIKSGKIILPSFALTVFCFYAMTLSEYGLTVLAGKIFTVAAVFSGICALIFLPSLVFISEKLYKEIHIFSLKGGQLRDVLHKLRFVSAALPVICLILGFLSMPAAEYDFSGAEMFSEKTTEGRDRAHINKYFPETGQLILLIPDSDFQKQSELSADLKELTGVKSIISYADRIGAEIPLKTLDESEKEMFVSDNYSKLLINMDSKAEETYEAIELICENYYGSTYLMTGEPAMNYEIKNTVRKDFGKAILIIIIGTYLLLTLIYKNYLLPAIPTAAGAAVVSLLYFILYIGYGYIHTSALICALPVIWVLSLTAFLCSTHARGKITDGGLLLAAAVFIASAIGGAGFLSANIIYNQIAVIIISGAAAGFVFSLAVLPSALHFTNRAIEKCGFYYKLNLAERLRESKERFIRKWNDEEEDEDDEE